MEENNIDDEIVGSNKEIADNLTLLSTEKIKTFSRDWTVETIYTQIVNGNIDLNPKFQRRNAWDDEKRSRLIESLILKFPIPEIVLAESHTEKDKFIVLDGKQRLLTIAGYIDNERFRYWDKPNLKNLKIKTTLNNLKYDDLKHEDYKDIFRAFQNSDIRCTIVFNQTSDDILYEIFYRLNSGAVPLSMQELRQSLRKGGFSDFLMESTQVVGPLHNVLGIDTPDKRLIDAEILLKFISNRIRLNEYSGNLKTFLDNTLLRLNSTWSESTEADMIDLLSQFNNGINLYSRHITQNMLGRYSEEKRFNRNLFDVQIFYFSQLSESAFIEPNLNKYIEGFKVLTKPNSEFRNALTSSTNTMKNFVTRFNEFRQLVNISFSVSFPQILNLEDNE